MTDSLENLSVSLRDIFNKKNVLKQAKLSAAFLKRAIQDSTKHNLNKAPEGHLAQMWKETFKLSKGGKGVTISATNALPYASIHEAGGIIWAKNKYLAIPLSDAVKKRGWPKQWPDAELRFGITKAGTPVLFTPPQWKKNSRKRKKNRRPNRKRSGPPNVYGPPKFFLTEAVMIEPTYYMSEGLDNAQETIVPLWDRMMG